MSRDPNHNYKNRCIYHITIGKAVSCLAFSKIEGNLSGPLVRLSPIGGLIAEQIVNLQTLSPGLQILQYVIMPDHVHFIVYVRETLPIALGRYIGMMKVKCLQIARERCSSVSQVFAPGFHDRYLRKNHSLTAVINYVQENPFRLLARRLNPEYFRRLNNIDIAGNKWQAYGNMQLLDNPFKAPVVIHRADSEGLLLSKYRRWKHLAENGGVLVSPFISPKEKEVRAKCEAISGKIILLTNKPMGEKQKPAAHDFELCTQGRLLILAPMAPLPPGRETFLYLNSIAELLTSAH